MEDISVATKTSPPAPTPATKETNITSSNSDTDVQRDPQIPSAASRNLIIFALGLAILVGVLDATIVATLVPTIADDFHSVGSSAWYGSAYLLVTGAIQPVFGKIYSTFQSKFVFLSSVAILEVGSLVCALAKNSPTFIAGRANCRPWCCCITALTTPLKQRPVYTAVLGSLEGVGVIIGPIIGGQIASSIGWRWCFWINLPIGAVLCAILVFCFHPPKRTPEQKQEQAGKTWTQKPAQLDLEGGLAIAGSITCLLIALEWGGEAATFPTRLLKSRTFSMFLLCGLCFGGAQFAVLYYLPMWFQAVQGVSAAESGTRLLAMVVSVIVVSVIAGGSAGVVGYLPPFVFFATIFSSVGAGMLYTLHPGISTFKWIGYQILFGAGSGTGIQQAIVGVQVAVDRNDIAYATSAVMLVNTLAGSIFIAVSQTLFLGEMRRVTEMIPNLDRHTLLGNFRPIRDKLDHQELDIAVNAYNRGITKAFLIGLVFCSTTVLTWPLIRWIPLKKPEDPIKSEPTGDPET
ncbi:major facilitator superfamily transporter [Fusarium proliferatum]|nr:major facilitator superfamily transporter [Fusarium proliferatum]